MVVERMRTAEGMRYGVRFGRAFVVVEVPDFGPLRATVPDGYKASKKAVAAAVREVRRLQETIRRQRGW
jgi:hypothetical protein